MEEKKTIVPRRRMSPFLRKILLLLVLLLIPIFLAGAGFLVYSIINARESGRERIDTAVSTQLEDLDSSLSMVNLYLTETLMNNSLTKKITQIAITSWTPRGKNLGHGWSRRIYP